MLIAFADNEQKGENVSKKIQAIVMLATGSALFFWGYNISQSVSSKLGQALNGSPPDKAMIMMILGGLCAAFGFFKLFKLR
jgi:hypothetical protein